MLAFGMMQVVQGVVAFELTGKNSAVGFVSLGTGITMITLGPVGGALSDRVSKKKLLAAAQFMTGAVFAVVATLIVTGHITIMLLAGASLVMGAAFALMGPTRQAWVGDMLSGPDLSAGVALQQLLMNATRIVGPLIAGVLIGIGAVGTGGTYFVMTGLFVCVVVTLTFMKASPPRPRTHPVSMFADLAAGFRYIWSAPDVRLLTLLFVGVVLSGFSYQTIMPGYLEHELGHPASQLGLIFGTTAVGGIVTTLILAGRQLRDPLRMMMVFGVALAGSLALLAVAPGFIAALLVASLVGASSSGFQMLNNVNLMQRCQPQFFGRVMAVTMMAFGVNSLVAYPIGQLADHAGERTTMALLSVLCLVIIAGGSFALKFQGAKPGFATRPTPDRAPARDRT